MEVVADGARARAARAHKMFRHFIIPRRIFDIFRRSGRARAERGHGARLGRGWGCCDEFGAKNEFWPKSSVVTPSFTPGLASGSRNHFPVLSGHSESSAPPSPMPKTPKKRHRDYTSQKLDSSQDNPNPYRRVLTFGVCLVTFFRVLGIAAPRRCENRRKDSENGIKSSL